MEYRIINHGLDDDLQREINAIAERGWVMFRAYDPENWIDSEGKFIRIIWQRAREKAE